MFQPVGAGREVAGGTEVINDFFQFISGRQNRIGPALGEISVLVAPVFKVLRVTPIICAAGPGAASPQGRDHDLAFSSVYAVTDPDMA